ncbi:hypothetical protein, partial : Uncharacterized protein OS=Singulisphaera acidiphila (strain ATCC BAA-1392 / DSM 18658 / VKM B-2454 / MOB10) GN=Sinac_1252 PE=4 SV=1: DUF1501 [Gemmata massiliana]|uniref:DUF1501 domain-containing protein n=1 Tax=Gemmata massiliana TaxID=1210884 RepID=A0A6P2DHU0_9BACT
MLHRRDAMIRLGQLGAGGLALPTLLEARANTPAPAKSGTADSCIFIFLWGGPPQQDMWDMKPDAPSGIKSLFNPIDTAVPGIRVCDQMPLFARHTDKVALVRSLSHADNNHEPSVYHMLTGHKDPTLVSPRNPRKRSHPPSFASALAYFAKPSAVPANVTIPRPVGHDGVTYAGTYAGFLGPKYDPLEKLAANKSNEPAAHPDVLPPDVTQTRLAAREGLLKLLQKQDAHLQKTGGSELDDFRNQAMQMIAAPKVREAFDLNKEPSRLRDHYGRNEYGESFLLARRLVESGVKVVSVVWLYIMPNGGVANVWDNHGGTGGLGSITGYAMLKEKYCLPPLDRALAALLEDLSDRGMLERTLVAVAGEFGRTPKINKDMGRDHWGAAQTALFAGGGVRGGQVYGKTDKLAAHPTENPVSPDDFLATIYHAMGVDPTAMIPDRENRPHRLCDGKPVTSLFS